MTTRIRNSFAALTFAFATIVAMLPTQAAHADPAFDFELCHNYYITTGDTGYFDNGVRVYAGPWTNVPPSSQSWCKDINVSAYTTPESSYFVRVQFCPTYAPCYTNSWKYVTGSNVAQAATNVLNGTQYRVETSTSKTLDVWD